MRNRARTLLSAAAAVALAWTLTTPAAPAEWESTPEPEAGRVIQSAPTGAEAEEAPGPEAAAAPPAEARAIEDCTVTWYTADSCGKRPEHPAYGITASGLPVEEGVTCAVDPAVIPLFSRVWVARADGRLEELLATDTGVRGNWVDIYTPDYNYAIECGLQRLTVYWTAPEE